ncbi:MAG: hypothetical protein ACK4GU_16285 [Alishewanella aestuarii]
MTENTPFTKADAAKAVKRLSVEAVIDPKTKKPVEDKDGRVKTREVTTDVTEAEVLDFAVRNGVVTVVTTDGQKLTGKVA